MKLIVLVFFFSFAINAQNKLHKGYYIDNQNNKIDCSFKYWKTKNTPKSFDVILPDSKVPKTIGLSDAKIIVIENIAKFIKAKSLIDRHSASLLNLEFNPEIIKREEEHFFNCIIDEQISLLSYKDQDITKYFYSNNNFLTIYQLDYKKYFADYSGTQVATNIEYKKQLSKLVACNENLKLINNIQKVNYEQDDLMDIVYEINLCNSGVLKNPISKKEKTILKYKIVANANNIELLDKNDINFEKKIVPGIGFEVELIMPYYNNMFSILFNTDYSSYKSTTFYSYPILPVPYFDPYNNSNVDIKLSSFSTSFGVQWNILRKKNYRIFVFKNFGVPILGFNNNTLTFENKGSFKDVNVYVRYGNYGVGFNYKNFEIDYKFFNNIDNNYNSLQASRQTISLKYCFGK